MNPRQRRRKSAGGGWRPWLVALILALAGWGGASWMWNHVHPTGLMPLIFLLFVALALTGATFPLFWLFWRLRRRRRKRLIVPRWRPMREGAWVGLYGFFCGWLQVNRALTPAPALLLAGGLLFLELFFVLREKGGAQ